MISQKKRKSSSQYENEVQTKLYLVDFTKDCQKENSLFRKMAPPSDNEHLQLHIQNFANYKYLFEVEFHKKYFIFIS